MQPELGAALAEKMPRPLEHWSESGFANRRAPGFVHEIDPVAELERAVIQAHQAHSRLDRWVRKSGQLPRAVDDLRWEALLTTYPVDASFWWGREKPAPTVVRLHELNWVGALRLIGPKLRMQYGYVEAAANVLAARTFNAVDPFAPSDEECLAAIQRLADNAEEVHRGIEECLSDVQIVLFDEWDDDWEAYDEIWINRPPDDIAATEIEELIVDPDTFEVRCGRRCCHLGNNRLFRIFQRLADDMGKCVEHDVLIEAGWLGKFVSDGALYTAVSELRDALSAAGFSHLTIHGKKNQGHYTLMTQKKFVPKDLLRNSEAAPKG